MSELTQASAETKALTAALEEARAKLKQARDAQTDLALSATKNAAATLEARQAVVAQARDVEKAAATLKAATSATGLLSEAQKELASKLDKVKEISAKGISDELPEKLKSVRDGFRLAGDSSLSAGQRMQAFSGAAGIAARTATNLAAQLWQSGRAASQAASQYQEHERTVARLGTQYVEIQQATAGAVTAEQAAHAQRELTERGLNLQGTALVTVSRALREYARDHQTTADEALSVFSGAVDGDTSALDRYGVAVGNAGTRAERFARIQQQLATQQRGQGVAGRSGGEDESARAASLERLGQSYSRVFLQHLIVPVNFIADTVAPKLETAFSRVAGRLNETFRPEAARAMAAELERNASAEQQRASAASAALSRRREQEAQIHTETVANAQRELAVQTSLLAHQGEAVDTRVRSVSALAAYNDVLSRSVTLTQREGETDEQFAQRRLAGINAVAQARQVALQVERHGAEQARQGDTLGVLTAQIRAHGGIVAAQIRSVSVQQQHNNLMREARDLRRSELETAEEFAHRAEETLQRAQASQQAAEQRAAAAAQMRMGLRNVREQLGLVGTDAVQRARVNPELRTTFSLSQMGDYQTTNEDVRRRLDRDMNDPIRRADGERTVLDVLNRQLAARQRLLEISAAYEQKVNDIATAERAVRVSMEDQIREKGLQQTRDQSAVDLTQSEGAFAKSETGKETIETERAANDFGLHLRGAFTSTVPIAQRAAQDVKAATDIMTGAFVSHVDALISGREDAGQAMLGFAADSAKAVAMQALPKSIYYAGEAIAATFTPGLQGLAPGMWTASGIMAGVAVGFGGLAAGLGAAQGAAQQPTPDQLAGGGGGPARGSELGAGRSESGPVIHQYNFNGLVTETQAARSLARVQNRGARAGIRPTFAERSR